MPGVLYRTTGVSLSSLRREDTTTADLFGESIKSDKNAEVFSAIDRVAHKYGEHTIFLASSLKAFRASDERIKKTLDIPFLGKVR